MKKIGKDFVIKIKAVAVKAKGRGCDSCVLSGANCDMYPCLSADREDKEDIIYIEAKYKDNES